jgi:hypothetical protein
METEERDFVKLQFNIFSCAISLRSSLILEKNFHLIFLVKIISNTFKSSWAALLMNKDTNNGNIRHLQLH